MHVKLLAQRRALRCPGFWLCTKEKAVSPIASMVEIRLIVHMTLSCLISVTIKYSDKCYLGHKELGLVHNSCLDYLAMMTQKQLVTSEQRRMHACIHVFYNSIVHDHMPRERGCPHRLSLPTLINLIIEAIPPTDTPTSQPDQDTPSLPSHVILDCVKPTSKTTTSPSSCQKLWK